ncbi:MerR family transcriptional regulator [Streptomyces sedi]|uniref:MerR family transcriptional regulator n=1 Tax=Streptomyces sedi TaxID=555059 RepID=A0A5C4UQ91_9ACTN|nr:MerR family transcriptional regulator [Streptomyces sedi]TNM25787.1 MerR family transcriptional regulator [Streptomyces sedi]
MTTQLLRIGETAERLGVSTHLLRHWEAEGVITPERTAGGARRYGPELRDALAIAVKCQHAGMSLSTIAQLLNGPPGERRRLVAEQRDAVDRHRARLERTAAFLDHVLRCTHPVVRECPECRAFASSTP